MLERVWEKRTLPHFLVEMQIDEATMQNSKEIPLKTWEFHDKRELHESESRSVVLDSLQPHGLQSPWNSPDQNTAVGSHSLLQGIFAAQGSNQGLQHCKWILYQLSHQGSPRILEWAAVPFSRGSSWPRNWTGVSCFAGVFFTCWAIRGAQRELPYDPAISLLGIHLEKMKTLIWKDTWTPMFTVALFTIAKSRNKNPNVH